MPWVHCLADVWLILAFCHAQWTVAAWLAGLLTMVLALNVLVWVSCRRAVANSLNPQHPPTGPKFAPSEAVRTSSTGDAGPLKKQDKKHQ